MFSNLLAMLGDREALQDLLDKVRGPPLPKADPTCKWGMFQGYSYQGVWGKENGVMLGG